MRTFFSIYLYYFFFFLLLNSGRRQKSPKSATRTDLFLIVVIGSGFARGKAFLRRLIDERRTRRIVFDRVRRRFFLRFRFQIHLFASTERPEMLNERRR